MLTLESICPNCMSSRNDSESCNTCEDKSYPQYPSIALPVKTILNNRFWIGRVLGRPGGFGVTYLAWDSVLETTAAIKEFLPLHAASRAAGDVSVLPNSEQDRDFFQQGLRIFLQEAKTLAQFSHANIVRIRDYFTANNTAYLVMDYHNGIPLDQYVENHGGKLTEDRAMELMLPILDGLESIHQKKFLHRDIKPQNIYLTEEGVPILLDFGAARYAMVEKSSTLTVMLTAGFAPFEQYHKKGRQGPWSDIYACAATLYYLVTGNVPADALERQHHDRLVPPIELNPSISESFNIAILKAMSVDVMMRPRSIGAFKRLLLDHSFNHSSAAEIIKNPASNTFETLLETSFDSPKPLPLKNSNPSVIIRYETEKKSNTFMRLVVLALLSIIAYLYWNSRESPEQTGRAIVAPTKFASVSDVEDRSLIEAAPIEPKLGDIETSSQFVWEPESVNDQQSVQPPPQEIDRQPTQNSTDRIKPRVMRRPPKHAYDVCRQKFDNDACQFNTPFGIESGSCKPVEYHRLACVPHRMPPPPSQLGRHDLRREPPSRPDARYPLRNNR